MSFISFFKIVGLESLGNRSKQDVSIGVILVRVKIDPARISYKICVLNMMAIFIPEIQMVIFYIDLKILAFDLKSQHVGSEG